MRYGKKTGKNALEKLCIAMALLLAITFLAVIAAATSESESTQQGKAIITNLTYGQTPGFDGDDNGVANSDSVIDFSVSQTSFSWQVNETNLCTLWRVLPLQAQAQAQAGTAALVCYGAAHCCSLADLAPKSEKWNETFYLYSGAHNVTDSAIVSAKAVYADYRLSGINPYYDIVHSDWGTLTALFTSTTPFTPATPAVNSDFSTSSQSTTLTVNSPSNSSALGLQSGEKIALSVTLNTGDSALYSLDGSANATMQGNTTAGQSNYTAALQGSLQGSVLANGTHLIVIHAYANATANTTARLEHPFAVSDTTPPQITLSPAINNTAASSLSQSYNINATSNEYANISYKLNSESYAAAATVAHSANITITPGNGQNSLAINSTDMHGNWLAYYYTFNFTYNGSGTCTDAVRNYHDGANETGIDCGGPCAACVTFAVSSDKDAYAVGEFVYISVTARSDARHNITIAGPSYHTSFAYNGSTYYIISPTNPGPYKINVSLAYRNLSPEYVTKNFTINSTSSLSLSVSILANATTIDKNEAVEFRPQVAGNTSAISYKWDLNGDGSTDSTAASVNYTYDSPGSYTASLNVSDGTYQSRAAETITVRQLYNITINVTGTAGEAISSALVTVKGMTKPSAPLAQYQLSARTYTVYINATAYRNREGSITVGGNDTFSFVLKKHDDTAPVVTLISPENNALITAQNITLRFSVQDETINTCTAYISKGSTSWVQKSADAVRSQALQQELNVSGLENATYQWRIECADEEKHTNSSETRTFTVQLQQQSPDYNTTREEERIMGLISEISSVLAKISSYGRLEQEAAETLKLENSIEKTKTELQRLLRDIRNVKWRRFNATEEDAFIRGKANDAEIIAGNVTTGIAVVTSAKFVMYHGESAIKEAANYYFAAIDKNNKPSKKEIDQYVKENLAVQQAAIMTTGYKIVEMKTSSGKSKLVTLIEKALDFSGNTTDLMLLEVIPKEMAKSASEIKFLFEYSVLEDDPVIRVELPEGEGEGQGKKYAYYIEKEFTQQQVQKTSTVLLKKEFKTGKRKAQGITGFAIFSGRTPLGNPASRLAAEIMIVILLGAVYIAYSKGLLRRESKQLTHIKSLVQQIRATLQLQQKQASYEKSKQLYALAKEAFKLLMPEERKLLYETLSELRYEIDAQYVRTLINEANALLLQGRHGYAEKTYEKLNTVYKSLPPSYRKLVYSSCAQLHEKIRG